MSMTIFIKKILRRDIVLMLLLIKKLINLNGLRYTNITLEHIFPLVGRLVESLRFDTQEDADVNDEV